MRLVIPPAALGADPAIEAVRPAALGSEEDWPGSPLVEIQVEHSGGAGAGGIIYPFALPPGARSRAVAASVAMGANAPRRCPAENSGAQLTCCALLRISKAPLSRDVETG